MSNAESLDSEIWGLYYDHKECVRIFFFNLARAKEDQVKLDSLLTERKPSWARNNPTWWDSQHWQEKHDDEIARLRYSISSSNQGLEKQIISYDENIETAREHLESNLAGYMDLAVELAKEDGKEIRLQ